jgi:hypothetical protein
MTCYLDAGNVNKYTSEVKKVIDSLTEDLAFLN